MSDVSDEQQPELVRVKKRRRRRRRSYSMPKTVDFRSAPSVRTGPFWWTVRALAVVAGILLMLAAMSALARRHGAPPGLPWPTAWMSYLGYPGWSYAVRSAIDDSMTADQIEAVLGPADERSEVDLSASGGPAEAVRLVYFHGRPDSGAGLEDGGATSARGVSFVRAAAP